MDLKGWRKVFAANILILLCMRGVQSEITCTPGLEMPGYTVPQGDIILEEGSDLDIMCVVVNNTYNSASLSFQKNSEPIPSENIEVINSTAIKLHYPNPPLASGDTFTCLLNNKTSVCMNRVTVGKKPQKVTDFKCIGYNYDNLTCTWTAPENYVHTTYNLSFTIPDGRSARYPYPCPRIVAAKRNMSCLWNVSTTPPYRLVHPFFNFTLTMTNKFGTNQINEFFKHFAHVLSGPPENLTALSTTPSSIYLYWMVPMSMQTFPPGIHHRILYQCEYGDRQWNDGGILSAKNFKEAASYNLTNLKYAHALCDIRVSLRSAKALPNDESMWSRNASITVRTSSKVPDVPPETTPGSFEVVTSNDLEYREAYIYWKQIQESQKNGPEFKYRVTVEGDDLIKPDNLTNTYAKFHNLSNTKDYVFHIWSINANGTSIHRSTVYIPKQAERIKEPVSFTKVELREGKYELTWEPPELQPGQVITNYTIFACSNEKDRPYQCNGLLNWTIVPSDKTAINITVNKDKVYQFAISANTHNSSSGMLWAACTIIHNKSIGKIRNVLINRVGSTFIELGWKLDCSDRIGSVESFVVYYCPIVSPSVRECKGEQQKVIFHGASVTGGNITGLSPYTTYMLAVAVITKYVTYSQQSDPLFNTTLEDAPTEPYNLEIIDVSNTSISVKWVEPKARNGILKYYEVEIQGEDAPSQRIELQINPTNFTFSNLSSYVNYTIAVKACTVKCSDTSQVIVATRMGYPSRINKPTVDRRNDTTISIIWNRPSQPGGINDHYVVRLRQKHRDGNQTLIYNTTNNRYIIENCGDGGKFNTFYVSVKAVNKIYGRSYEGEWSDELENYCYTPFNYLFYVLLLGVIGVLIFIGFLFTRLYHRCKIMRDVEVKLPPGLAPVVADHTLVPWSTEKHQESRASHSPPDEELLLVKMTEGRHFSGDSSGCSSGHESVTSSLESGTHISSSSDSGTEQPGNYCALGVNPKEDSAYIPVTVDVDKAYKSCEVPNESSPYVMTGEAVKRINPGYIPFNQTESLAKNSGYVVAGIKNVNGYIPFNQTESVSRNTGYVVAGIKNCKLD